MLLRLVVKRYQLPTVKLLWETDTTFKPTDDRIVSVLLARVNEVIPLECSQTGHILASYAVEIGGFECLHFHPVDKLFKEGEEILIRPRSDEELRYAEISGRHQRNRAGEQIVDGRPFKRSHQEYEEDRPEVFIPARKRMRSDGPRSSTLRLRGSVEDESEDEDGYGDSGSSRSGHRSKKPRHSSTGKKAPRRPVTRRGRYSGSDDSNEDLRASSTHHQIHPEKNPELSSSENDDEDFKSHEESEDSSEHSSSESHSSSDDNHSHSDSDREGDDTAVVKNPKQKKVPVKPLKTITSTVPPPNSNILDDSSISSDSAGSSDSASSSDSSDSSDSSQSSDSSDSDSESDKSDELPVKGPAKGPGKGQQAQSKALSGGSRGTAPGTLPHEGSAATAARNQRKKTHHKLTMLKEKNIVDLNMNHEQFRAALTQNGLTFRSAVGEMVRALTSSLVAPLEPTHVSQTEIATQPAVVASQPGVKAATQPTGEATTSKVEITKSARKAFKRALLKGEVSDDMSIEQWVAEGRPRKSENPVVQAATHAATAQLHSAYKVPPKKYKQRKRSGNKVLTRIFYDENGNPIEVQNDDGEEDVDMEEQEEAPQNPDAWRSKIVLSAVECGEDGENHILPTPNFPFDQSQLQGGGKNRKRKRVNGDCGRTAYAEDYNKDYGQPYEQGQDYSADMYDDPVVLSMPEGKDEVPFPPIPRIVFELPALVIPVSVGTVFVYKCFDMDAKYNPIITDYRRARVVEVEDQGSSGTLLHVVRPVAELPKKVYDPETGERILGKFEMPIDDEESNIYTLYFSELLEPKILSAPKGLTNRPKAVAGDEKSGGGDANGTGPDGPSKGKSKDGSSKNSDNEKSFSQLSYGAMGSCETQPSHEQENILEMKSHLEPTSNAPNAPRELPVVETEIFNDASTDLADVTMEDHQETRVQPIQNEDKAEEIGLEDLEKVKETLVIEDNSNEVSNIEVFTFQKPKDKENSFQSDATLGRSMLGNGQSFQSEPILDQADSLPDENLAIHTAASKSQDAEVGRRRSLTPLLMPDKIDFDYVMKFRHSLQRTFKLGASFQDKTLNATEIFQIDGKIEVIENWPTSIPADILVDTKISKVVKHISKLKEDIPFDEQLKIRGRCKALWLKWTDIIETFNQTNATPQKYNEPSSPEDTKQHALVTTQGVLTPDEDYVPIGSLATEQEDTQEDPKNDTHTQPDPIDITDDSQSSGDSVESNVISAVASPPKSMSPELNVTETNVQKPATAQETTAEPPSIWEWTSDENAIRDQWDSIELAQAEYQAPPSTQQATPQQRAASILTQTPARPPAAPSDIDKGGAPALPKPMDFAEDDTPARQLSREGSYAATQSRALFTGYGSPQKVQVDSSPPKFYISETQGSSKYPATPGYPKLPHIPSSQNTPLFHPMPSGILSEESSPIPSPEKEVTIPITPGIGARTPVQKAKLGQGSPIPKYCAPTPVPTARPKSPQHKSPSLNAPDTTLEATPAPPSSSAADSETWQGPPEYDTDSDGIPSLKSIFEFSQRIKKEPQSPPVPPPPSQNSPFRSRNSPAPASSNTTLPPIRQFSPLTLTERSARSQVSRDDGEIASRQILSENFNASQRSPSVVRAKGKKPAAGSAKRKSVSLEPIPVPQKKKADVNALRLAPAPPANGLVNKRKSAGGMLAAGPSSKATVVKRRKSTPIPGVLPPSGSQNPNPTGSSSQEPKPKPKSKAKVIDLTLSDSD